MLARPAHSGDSGQVNCGHMGDFAMAHAWWRAESEDELVLALWVEGQRTVHSLVSCGESLRVDCLNDDWACGAYNDKLTARSIGGRRE